MTVRGEYPQIDSGYVWPLMYDEELMTYVPEIQPIIQVGELKMGAVVTAQGSAGAQAWPVAVTFPEVQAISGEVEVTNLRSFVSVGNSSTEALDADATFTGASEEVKDYAAIVIGLKTDKDSATDGLVLEWSPDGTNWDQSESYTITGGVPFFANATIRGRYFRIRYTNSNSDQTYFRLQTIYDITAPTPRKRPVGEVPDDDNPALLTQSVIVGRTTGVGGGYVAVKVTPSGAITGEMEVSNFPAVQVVRQSTPSSPVVSEVAVSETNITLLSVNADRRGAFVFNDSDGTMYVKFGETASATSYTTKLHSGGLYEFPFPAYNGRVDALWSEGSVGFAYVTELE